MYGFNWLNIESNDWLFNNGLK